MLSHSIGTEIEFLSPQIKLLRSMTGLNKSIKGITISYIADFVPSSNPYTGNSSLSICDGYHGHQFPACAWFQPPKLCQFVCKHVWKMLQKAHLLTGPASYGALKLEHGARDLVLEGRLALVVMGHTSPTSTSGSGLPGRGGSRGGSRAVATTAKPAHDAGLAGGGSGLASGGHCDKRCVSCSLI